MKEDNNNIEYDGYGNECCKNFSELFEKMSDLEEIEPEYVGDYTIETYETLDHNWETAIHKDTMYISGQWIVVARYKNRELAEMGHKIFAAICVIEPDGFYSIEINKPVMF